MSRLSKTGRARRWTRRAGTLAAAAALAALLSGCFALRREAERNELINLDRVDRVESGEASTTYRAARLEEAGLRPSDAPPPERSRPARTITREEATGGVGGVAVAPETDSPATAEAPAPGGDGREPARGPDAVVSAPIDALVGQVSGRPVFASEFFESMDARLQAESRREGRREFLVGLREQVAEALRDTIRDELLLAEFEATLSPAQRQGLATFVQGIRQNLIRRGGGSTELANQLLIREEGLTLEEKVEAESRQQLVRQMVGQLLRDRAWIPWRDVRRAYLRDLDEYRPPPTARYRVIMAPADDAERLAAIQRELQAGRDFGAIAESYSVFRPEQRGRYEVRVAQGGLAETEVFADAILNDRATALSAGETVGPFEWSSRRVWMTLESVDAEGVSLYEAQDEILSELRQQRLLEVQAEFFGELEQRGSLSDVERMRNELFRLGAERYLIASENPSENPAGNPPEDRGAGGRE